MFDRVPGASGAPSDPAHEEPLGDLITSARKGDEAAWQHLHSRFSPLLRSIAARYRLHDADADDVIQATWVKCFEKLATLREPAALPGWLSAICHHEALRTLKAHTRTLPMDCHNEATSHTFATPNDTTAHDALAALTENQPQTILHALLDDLDERDHKLMWALTAEDSTYHRVATTLNMPIGSIGPTRQRIITRLQRKAQALQLAA